MRSLPYFLQALRRSRVAARPQTIVLLNGKRRKASMYIAIVDHVDYLLTQLKQGPVVNQYHACLTVSVFVHFILFVVVIYLCISLQRNCGTLLDDTESTCRTYSQPTLTIP